MNLRISTPQERALQASKWLSCQILIDPEEMQSLFESLSPLHLYLCGLVLPKSETEVPVETFLNVYKNYIQELKEGKLPEPKSYQKWFCCAMTKEREALYSVPINENDEIVKISSPIIQMRAHTLDYSPIDKRFHSMVFGKDSIPWGIQFAYPQLTLDPTTQEVLQIRQHDFSNNQLFKTLQQWVRANTIPTPFIIENEMINESVRLGKNCLNWINKHPTLIKKSISVKSI